ncbi:MAG TPA: hypothetical protein VL359_12820, partial [bacterium]|nr:hypothetical protein [bacterium]
KPFRLLPSKVALPGWQDLDAAAASELLARFTTRPGGRPPLETPLPARPARTAIIRRLLAGWRATLAAASPSFAWQEPSDNLGASATALSITFLLEPRGLVDAIRHRRHGHRDLAEGAAERALASATAFLGGLERRVPADA